MTQAGDRFGHYTVLGTLGAGGMGDVWLARDERLGREVALKLLPPRFAGDPEQLLRFRREALTLAALNHPNIAVIHGFEEGSGGTLALVLERVEGESLSARLRRGAMAPAEAMQVCVQIAEALEAAHERGVVHRDLKPGNVMLAPRGLVKVLDFGLARRVGDLPAGRAGLGAEAAPRTRPATGAAGHASEDVETLAVSPRAGAAAPVAEDAETLVVPPPSAGTAAAEAETVAIPPAEEDAAGDDAETVAVPPAAGTEAVTGSDLAEAETVAMPARHDPEPSQAPTIASILATSGSEVTMEGIATGTPGFMSPEQVKGAVQDHRTDIFAFGCVLYECLTGSSAFPGKTPAERMRRTLERTADLAALPERTPASVRELLERCLEKDLERRLADMVRARHVLEEALGIRRAAALRAGEAAEIPNNLPASATSFVGRERELAECAQQLEATRWLTLAGMGGSGKTRLARRLAEQVLESYPDGVWFVDLTALKHPERVAESLAEATGVQPEPGVPIARTLVRHFAEQRVLVVLDNCEEVPEPVGTLAAELLGGCPGLRLLATSREPVGAEGEVVVAVAPLGLPEDGRAMDLAALAGSESVRLFVERARVAQPGFALSAANAPAVGELCRRLDGIPLALELAAARLRMLSLEEVLSRLGDRFRLLTAGGRGVPARQQTLRATIEWSVEHLSEDERELFVELGVFASGWSLEAAVAVAGRDEFEVLDALTRLVERSLVVVAPSAAGTRYRYLETVRELALERLAGTGAERRIRDRHLEHFLEVAEESERKLAGPEQKPWLMRLDAEHSDLLAAHAWCGGDETRAVKGLRLVGSLWRYWSARGHYALAGRTLREALERPGARGRDAVRAAALVRAVAFAIIEVKYADARPLIEEGLSIFREVGDRRGVARCLGTLASLALLDGALDEARERSAESLTLYREAGRTAGAAMALHNLGFVALARGDLAEAHARYEEALQALAETGDDRQLAHTLADSARVLLRQGKLKDGRVRLVKALQLVRNLGARREATYVIESVAELAIALADNCLAASLLGSAQTLRETIGAPLARGESDEQRRTLDYLRESLGDQPLEQCLAAGRARDWDATSREALAWMGAEGARGAEQVGPAG